MAVKDPGYSPFIQAVAGDGTSPPDVRLLTGWLGPSGEAGSVRVYLDATLSAYVDIPKDAVLYSEEIPNSHPSGQRSVWVKNDAELKEGGSAIARASKFLFGQVQQDFGGAQAAGVPPQVQQTQICLTYKPGCQQPQRFTRIPCSAIDACPSALIECQQTSPPCITAAPCTCPGPVTVRWPDCGSAVDACPTRICAQPEMAQQQVGGPGFATRFCTPPPLTPACPATMFGCPTAGFCPPRTAGCPPPSAFCPTRFNCPVPSQFQCPSFGRCPSAVDACPSSLGCTFACNVNFDWTIVQQTPVLQPRFDANVFGGGFVGAAGKTVILPGPGTSQFCITSDCQTPIIACPDPNPSVGKPCASAIPALCPDVRQPFAANVGWTTPNACPYHSYPMCNSHIPCATAPPCF